MKPDDPRRANLRRGGGRTKGVPNKTSKEVRALALRLVTDKTYLKDLAARLKIGKAPHMEPVLWAYAYGKPKESVEHTGLDGQPIALKVVFGGRYRPAGEAA